MSSVVPAPTNCSVRSARSVTRMRCTQARLKTVLSSGSRVCPESCTQCRPSKAVRFTAFQYVAVARLHAQHLATVARPVQRAVVMVPAVLRRRRRAERLGELLVVQQRAVAVEQRRGDVAAERRRRDERRGEAGAAALHALEPQKRGEQQREQQPGEERQPHVVLHDRRRVERAERDGGGDRVAEPVTAPRHERQQRGEAGERAAAEHDHDPGPLVEAVVGRAHGRDRAEPLADAGGKVVPAVRLEQPARHARSGERDQQQQRGGEQRDRDPDRRRRAAARDGGQPVAGDRGGEDAAEQRVGRGRLHHARPLQRAERGERDEADQPRDGGGQQRGWRRRCGGRRRAGAAAGDGGSGAGGGGRRRRDAHAGLRCAGRGARAARVCGPLSS